MDKKSALFLSIVHIPKKHSWNPYEIHRCLWELFPEVDAAASRPFLFRTEEEKKKIPFYTKVLMQSVIEPQKNASRADVIQCKEFSPVVEQNQFVRFFCKANPTRRVSTTAKRTPIVSASEQKKWIANKLGAAGTISGDIIIDKLQVMDFFKKKENEKKVGKITTVELYGILKITNPENFQCLLKTGIGSAKSFGCGMLSVAKF